MIRCAHKIIADAVERYRTDIYEIVNYGSAHLEAKAASILKDPIKYPITLSRFGVGSVVIHKFYEERKAATAAKERRRENLRYTTNTKCRS